MSQSELRKAQEILKEMARLIHQLANVLQAMQPQPETLTKIRGEGGKVA